MADSSAFSQAFAESLFRFELGYIQPIDGRLSRCLFHHHFSTEVVYHRQGSGTTALDNGKKVAFEEGSVVVYPPGMVHNQLTRLPAVDIVIHIEALDPRALDPQQCLYVPPVRDQFIVALLEELGSTASQVDTTACVWLSLKASALMHQLLVRARRAEATQGPDETLAARAYDHMRIHYRSIRRLPDVAAELGTSHGRLRRAFRRVYGFTMKAWLRRVRREQARVLLRNTVLPQQVIADLCGYCDEQYFCRDFRQQTGATPGRFRRQGRVDA